MDVKLEEISMILQLGVFGVDCLDSSILAANAATCSSVGGVWFASIDL